MKSSQMAASAAIVLIGVVAAALVLRWDAATTDHESGHAHSGHGHAGEGHAGEGHAGDDHAGAGHSGDGHSDAERARGPHGGRLLSDGDFSVEVAIHEHGVPPRFRVYAYDGENRLDPAEVDVRIELVRLGERGEAFGLRPQGAYLVSDRVVAEPHSFDVTVSAVWKGRPHRWQYASHEGRVELSAQAAASSGIVIDTVGPARLTKTLRAYGRVVPNEDRMAHVIPRYPGIVKEVRKRLGDPVGKGEVLAVIESNESLERYSVVSEISGTIIKKHLSPGEFAERGEDVYIVADLSTVWVDLNVYRQDFGHLRLGQQVAIDAGEGIERAHATINYISPFGAESTQSMLARTELPNPTGEWKPGLFVSGEIRLEEVQVPLSVRTTALQTLRDWDVVFVREGDVYEARPVVVGRRNGDRVEIRSGLRLGQQYVAENSFVLKADLGKAGAAHDH